MQIIPSDVAARAGSSTLRMGIFGCTGYLSIWSFRTLNPYVGVSAEALNILINPYFETILFGKSSSKISEDDNDAIRKSIEKAYNSSWNSRALFEISWILKITLVGIIAIKSFGEILSIRNLLVIEFYFVVQRIVFNILNALADEGKFQKNNPLSIISSKTNKVVSKASNVLTSKKKQTFFSRTYESLFGLIKP